MDLTLSEALDAIVKAYDIRGTYPKQINAEVCNALGVGFAAFIGDAEPDTTSVVIARDMRPSGPELVAAFAEGVMSQGLDVIDVGMGSTDLLYYASGTLNMPGAMFTASHNPAEYNGIKICASGAAPIGSESGLEVIKRVAIEGAEPADRAGTVKQAEMLEGFAQHVLGFVGDTEMRPLKVVVDTANGMGGLVVPEVLKHFPFDVEIMYAELDGTFPNHEANPIELKNLVDLQKRVLEVKADIGLAFDGDADRVFLVDEQAKPVSGSTTTALLAKAILANNPGGAVIHNLICSKAVAEIISEAGGEPVRSRVGHSFIKQTMAERNAVFGGEHSAHYYFRDNWRADSGLIASVMILEQLSQFDGPLSEMLAPFDRYSASGEINTRVSDVHAVIEHVSNHYKDLNSDRLDGLTVDAGDWWFNLRPSNTEPLLRLNLEASSDADVEARVVEVQKVMAEHG